MTKKEFNLRQFEAMSALSREETPVTDLDKAIQNLRFLRYQIMFNSIAFRRGCIKSLDYAIDLISQYREEIK